MNECIKIMLKGIVQGVGFRPFIYHLACDFGVCGTIKNTAHGVEIILVSNLLQAQSFIKKMNNHLPVLASIEHIEIIPFLTNANYDQFSILTSDQGASATKIPADTAICQNCLLETFDTASRYYHYPYTSCTHCGPRYSVIKALPYDRDKTSFVDFPLCQACDQVYQDPLNRRYHAQTTVCEDCGPKLSHSFEEMIEVIQQGKVLALKSHNGFRLIVDAKNSKAINVLRKRKKRPQKPFALMALNVASIKRYANLNQQEISLLQSNPRPIVLLNKGYISITRGKLFSLQITSLRNSVALGFLWISIHLLHPK